MFKEKKIEKAALENCKGNTQQHIELNDEELKQISGGNLIGNQLEVIGLASQNSAVNNITGSVSHSQNSQNTAQQVVIDAQSIDVLKNINVAENPLVLV